MPTVIGRYTDVDNPRKDIAVSRRHDRSRPASSTADNHSV